MNQRKLHPLVASLFLISSYFFCATPIYSAEGGKNELEHIHLQVQEIQKTLTIDLEKQSTLQEQLKATEVSLAALTQDISRITLLQTNEQHQLSLLKEQEIQDKLRLTQQHDALAQQVRVSYKLGKLYGIKLLLNKENANTLNRHLVYYRYLAEAKLTLIRETQLALLSLAHTLQTITEHEEQLQNILKQKHAQQQKLEAAQRIRERLISDIKQDVNTKKIRFSLLLENQKALQETLSQLSTQTDDITSHQPFFALQKKLSWPVKGPFLARFGYTLGAGNRPLAGVIIKAPLGTPVHAISSGKILFASWLRGFGLLVIINHGNGYMSLYARNQIIYPKVGEQIKTGDIISSIGNTGGQDTPTLYFEIRHNGIPINPSLWCRNT